MNYRDDNTVGLDFETYSDVVLKTHGTTQYMASPYFTPLVGSVVKARHLSVPRFNHWGFDFMSALDLLEMKDYLRELIGSNYVAAHHASFEARVLDWLGIHLDRDQFVDSEVVARCAGGGGRLEAAAAQLLSVPKDPRGKQLIRMFSIPSKDQVAAGDLEFDMNLTVKHATEWQEFKDYCKLDAELGLRLVLDWGPLLTHAEHGYMAATARMNEVGWHVDLDMVKEMQRRYEENKDSALQHFRISLGEYDLNLNSHPQQKKWCEDRGVKIKSFDKEHVADLIPKLNDKIGSTPLDDPKYEGYCEVRELLVTKQILGGSSLSKLARIEELTDADGRLRDQYAHAGAAQTLRASGRGVQMQNLKRLDADDLGDVGELWDEDSDWSNDMLAENLRQVFTSSHVGGKLIVGDLKTVEARGLAYIAGEDVKLQAFWDGKDMYKVMASQIYNVGYDDVLKSQRQTGKVGELSCGYGAGASAVQQFASGLGIKMTEAEAATIVRDWRAVNPNIVRFWWDLDAMLHKVVEDKQPQTKHLAHDGLILRIMPAITPTSLADQHPGAMSIEVVVEEGYGNVLLRRIFHGCYVRGRNISYYKPDTRESSQLWRGHYQHPKTKQRTFYSVYGGKLTGILVQSLCREIFMQGMVKVDQWCQLYGNVDLIGQFHDELVVDWGPGVGAHPDLAASVIEMRDLMSEHSRFPSFPLEADVKHDYRYTK